MLDPFRWAEVRRVERELTVRYVEAIDVVLAGLSTDNFQAAVSLAQLPELVRGYEHIKLANVENYREALSTALQVFRQSEPQTQRRSVRQYDLAMTDTHASGHAHDELGPSLLEEVAAGVYSYVQPDGTWFINNTGFIVGNDAVISIDATSTERRTKAYLSAIASVTPHPVTMLVNTHHHADHTHGNYLFADATVISSAPCREVMLAAGIPDYRAVFPGVKWGDLTFKAPDLTFSGSTTLHLDDMTVELHELGYVAHTNGDVIAWVPERKVLFAGDLVFHGGTPFTLFGSITGTLEALDLLQSYDADVIVPGHGPAFGGDQIAVALDGQRAYLKFVQASAATGIAAGLTPLEQAQATDLGEFATLTDTERLAGNLHVAYREAAPAGYEWPGFEVAIMDMVKFNGGKPPRCVA